MDLMLAYLFKCGVVLCGAFEWFVCWGVFGC
jgi:hypothetical protein